MASRGFWFQEVVNNEHGECGVQRPATLSDLIALIEGGSEEDRKQLAIVLQGLPPVLMVTPEMVKMWENAQPGQLIPYEGSPIEIDPVTGKNVRVVTCARCHAPLTGRPEDHECER